MKTEKLNDNTKTTANSAQIDVLKNNFPNCFDKNGNFNPNKLTEIVKSNGADITKESYGMNWLGKSYARLLANEPPLTLITEDTEHNTKPQNSNSENMLIKGDNLEVLKHLKNAYSESIKMIYIDPPYNTGGDGFVYNDDRKFTAEQLSELAGIDTDEAKRILEFTNSNSNSHSAWLTFMYPRLYIARELLKDDGVIFISIDDNELTQLKLMCDEDIFGESNLISQLTVLCNPRGRSQDKYFATNNEYLLIYAKGELNKGAFNINKTKEQIQVEYVNEDDLGLFRTLELRNTHREFGEFNRPNLFYPIYVSIESKKVSLTCSSEYSTEIYPVWEDGFKGCWTWGKDNAHENINLLTGKYVNNKWKVYVKDYAQGSTKMLKTIFDHKSFATDKGQLTFNNLFGVKEKLFQSPKSPFLLKTIIESSSNNNDIVLDFFAGSGTTGDAVMQLNAEDGGNRKYICVQLDEPVDTSKPAYVFCQENNLKPVISSITQERLIRAGKQIVNKYKTGFKPKDTEVGCEECGKKHKVKQKAIEPNPNFTLDTGFKVYETRPLIDGLSDTLDDDFTQIQLFDGELSKDNTQAILTTYKVHDGAKLNADFEEVILGKYTAYTVEDKIYFINTGFATPDLKTFITKLDTDKNFKPTKLVIFGYNFDSKHQREIKEAIYSYTNKKSLEIDMVVRY